MPFTDEQVVHHRA